MECIASQHVASVHGDAGISIGPSIAMAKVASQLLQVRNAGAMPAVAGRGQRKLIGKFLRINETKNPPPVQFSMADDSGLSCSLGM